MVAVGAEGGDEVGGVVVEGVVLGDGEKEVTLDVLFLWALDLLITFIDDGVLMGVVGDSGGIRQGGKEMWEEFGFGGKRE
jgi:hypothetical protein